MYQYRGSSNEEYYGGCSAECNNNSSYIYYCNYNDCNNEFSYFSIQNQDTTSASITSKFYFLLYKKFNLTKIK